MHSARSRILDCKLDSILTVLKQTVFINIGYYISLGKWHGDETNIFRILIGCNNFPVFFQMSSSTDKVSAYDAMVRPTNLRCFSG